jgi:periplasmic mercuric ion binding protein
MKKVILTLLSVLAISFVVSAQDKIKTVDIQTSIACDHCKQCESCGARIEKALYKEKGIKRVDIDDKKMKIKVVYNTQKISLDKIRNTIANNGYNADDVKATPESMALLDGCCKGE